MRKLIHFNATIEPPPAPPAPVPPSGDAKPADTAPTTAVGAGDEYPVAMLIGDGTYNGLFFPLAELQAGAASMERQPVNLDHSPQVEDEVGFVRGARMEGAALKGAIILNHETKKFATAKAFIQNRLAAQKAPEVSVGVFVDIESQEQEDGSVRLVARNLSFDHLALVTRGACGPEDGCGIGLRAREGTEVPAMPETKVEAAAPKVEQKAPANPTSEPAGATPPATAAAPSPCGCGGKWKDAQAEIDRIKAERDAALARANDERVRAKLAVEAEALGMTVAEGDTSECLKKKLAVAKEVLSKAEAQRHTAPVTEAANEVDAEVRKLLGFAGIAYPR